MSQNQLSDFEKGKIVAFSQCGMSNRLIASKLNRSHTAINKFFKHYNDNGNYQRKKGSGRKSKTTDSQDDEIIREAKRRRTSSAKSIRKEVNL